MRPYKRHYRTLLGDAFDVYLSILREVERRMQAALKRDTPDWRALNSCPACCYQLEGEPELPRGRMFAMDGNNSLKRLIKHGDRETADRRIFTESDYFLSREYVNKYKDEVKSRKQQTAAKTSGRTPAARTTDPDEEVDDVELGAPGEGDPTDGAWDMVNFVKICVKNWKSAAAEEKKKMWKIFDETGIFASACRHGFILWIANMIKSGELAKYPLAVMAKILEVIKDRPCGAYDIGCSFLATILKSSLAGPFMRANGTMIVNAFHGYSHNYACQMVYHPTRLTGMGLEDFETMERIFSASNALASVVRHMSPYRRGVFIDLHFQQWDRDKYENSALMLYNNYVQALGIIERERKNMEEMLVRHQCTEADLEAWAQEEANYIETLGEESPYDVHAMTYIELLQAWQHAKDEYTAANDELAATVPANYKYTPLAQAPQLLQQEFSETRKLETKRRRLAAKVEIADARAGEMEEKMGIERRWTPEDSAYKEMQAYTREREYHRALDHLQKLMVRRLFELQKLRMSGTGYKMRTQLAKSLQTRCRALRNAVDQYNKAAKALGRQTANWQVVTHFSFLEQFPLLRETRRDVLDRPWVLPDVRAAMQQQRRIKRAKEEIERCNIEIRCLHTHILDETDDVERILAELLSSSSPLYGPVKDWWTYRRRTNIELLTCIQRLYRKKGYTGNPTAGNRIGRAARSNTSTVELEVEAGAEDNSTPEVDEDGDDADNEELDTMCSYIDTLST
ncbi:hypothetical protein NM688_g9035 [Phlebia brevispora]|uniref:Uncharacterized protein n=1 Tax=Phlebia brevispora TaxID=194682 RepID=A0ACC1RLW6_9APHY|nr:hypothetical protein NM688_g9035 [Phlebia brevispora]